jgi:hypothetical protein
MGRLILTSLMMVVKILVVLLDLAWVQCNSTMVAMVIMVVKVLALFMNSFIIVRLAIHIARTSVVCTEYGFIASQSLLA